jgi:hypothetical protein
LIAAKQQRIKHEKVILDAMFVDNDLISFVYMHANAETVYNTFLAPVRRHAQVRPSLV